MAFVTNPAEVTAAQVSDATARVLDSSTYGEAARRIADEIAGTPPPASVVPWLASLAAAG
jgi:hypothetical protein